MHAPLPPGKFSLENAVDVPCMMGETDLALIKQILSDLRPNARLLEVGPWLGGISQHLAQYGTLHVVDRFIWSDLNAQNHPDILSPGQSFRPLFEDYLAKQGATPVIHQTEIEDFAWGGDLLDFCLIDMPRTASDLWHCLHSIVPSLQSNGFLLVKHGLTPDHHDMTALLGALVDHGRLAPVRTDQPHWCNIAVFQAGPKSAQALPHRNSLEIITDVSGRHISHDIITPETLILSAARMGVIAAQGQTPAACSLLRHQKPDPQMLVAWGKLEPMLEVDSTHAGAFAAFCELLEYHHSAQSKSHWAPASQSLTWALRHSWAAYMDEKDTNDFDIDAIAYAFARGDFNEDEEGEDT